MLASVRTDITPKEYAELALSPGSEISAVGVYTWFHVSALQKATRLATEQLAPAEAVEDGGRVADFEQRPRRQIRLLGIHEIDGDAGLAARGPVVHEERRDVALAVDVRAAHPAVVRVGRVRGLLVEVRVPARVEPSASALPHEATGCAKVPT